LPRLWPITKRFCIRDEERREDLGSTRAPRSLVDKADRRENAVWGIGLRQKLTVRWHLLPPRRILSGGNDNLNRRPAVLYRHSQPKPVHRARHVNVGDDNSDVVSGLEDLNCLIGIGCRNYLIAGVFQASKGLQDYNNKFLEFAHTNSNAAFGFMQKLHDVESPSEFMELSTEHARTQTQTLTEQTKVLAELAQKIALAGAKPLQEGLGKAFNRGVWSAQ
jgi:Phasin protein